MQIAACIRYDSAECHENVLIHLNLQGLGGIIVTDDVLYRRSISTQIVEIASGDQRSASASLAPSLSIKHTINSQTNLGSLILNTAFLARYIELGGEKHAILSLRLAVDFIIWANFRLCEYVGNILTKFEIQMTYYFSFGIYIRNNNTRLSVKKFLPIALYSCCSYASRKNEIHSIQKRLCWFSTAVYAPKHEIDSHHQLGILILSNYVYFVYDLKYITSLRSL